MPFFSHQNTFGCHVFKQQPRWAPQRQIHSLSAVPCYLKKRWGFSWKKILNFGRCFVLCSWAACSAGSLTVSFGTLHTKVTLIRQEEWRGEWHFPSRCCTTVARKCIQNAHTLFKYTPPILHISQDACIYECLHTCTCWYSICATYVEFRSNPLQWQGALLSMCKVYMWISFQLRGAHSFRLISNLYFSIFCLGASQKCVFCPGKLCIVLLTHVYWECLLLFFFLLTGFGALGGLTFKEGVKRADSTGPEGAGKIICGAKDQTVAQLGWVPFSVYDRDRCGRMTF